MAGFDPDAYLQKYSPAAAKGAGGFDPDAYLAKVKQGLPPDNAVVTDVEHEPTLGEKFDILMDTPIPSPAGGTFRPNQIMEPLVDLPQLQSEKARGIAQTVGETLVPGVGMLDTVTGANIPADIYNATAPSISGMTSPVMLATLPVAAEIHAAAAAGNVAARAAQLGISAYFAQGGAKGTLKAADAALKVSKDPNATLDDKIQAWAAVAPPAAITALAGSGLNDAPGTAQAAVEAYHGAPEIAASRSLGLDGKLGDLAETGRDVIAARKAGFKGKTLDDLIKWQRENTQEADVTDISPQDKARADINRQFGGQGGEEPPLGPAPAGTPQLPPPPQPPQNGSIITQIDSSLGKGKTPGEVNAIVNANIIAPQAPATHPAQAPAAAPAGPVNEYEARQNTYPTSPVSTATGNEAPVDDGKPYEITPGRTVQGQPRSIGEISELSPTDFRQFVLEAQNAGGNLTQEAQAHGLEIAKGEDPAAGIKELQKHLKAAAAEYKAAVKDAKQATDPDVKQDLTQDVLSVAAKQQFFSEALAAAKSGNTQSFNINQVPKGEKPDIMPELIRQEQARQEVFKKNGWSEDSMMKNRDPNLGLPAPRSGPDYQTPQQEVQDAQELAQPIEKFVGINPEAPLYEGEPRGELVKHSDPANSKWGHIAVLRKGPDGYSVELVDSKNDVMQGVGDIKSFPVANKLYNALDKSKYRVGPSQLNKPSNEPVPTTLPVREAPQAAQDVRQSVAAPGPAPVGEADSGPVAESTRVNRPVNPATAEAEGIRPTKAAGRSVLSLSGKDHPQQKDADAAVQGFLQANDAMRIRGNIYAVGDGAMEVYPYDGKIHLAYISTAPELRNKGNATRMLTSLTQYADKHGVPIDLEVAPLPQKEANGPGALKKKQLFQLYKKFGFERRPYSMQPDKLSDYMERQPQGQQEGASKMAVQQAKGMDTKRIIKMLGDKMYSENVARTTGKELVQNAIDAVKSFHNEGDGYVAVRAFHNADGDRVLVMGDNAGGMTPQVILDKFLPAGVSGKDVGQAGGLGLAKIAILGGNAKWALSSIAKDTEGNWIVTRLVGTGDGYHEYVSNPPQVDLRPNTKIPLSSEMSMYYLVIPKNAEIHPRHTGTVVMTSPGAGDVHSGSSFARNALEYHPDIREAYFNHEDEGSQDMFELRHASEYRNAGDPAELAGMESPGVFGPKTSGRVPGAQSVHTIETPAATIDFTVPRDIKNPEAPVETERKDYVYIPILNRNILQFEHQHRFNDEVLLPKDLSINIKPKVKAESKDYPFTSNREGVTREVGEAIGRYLNEIGAAAQKRQNALYKSAVDDAPKMTLNKGDLRFLDLGQNVPPEVVRAITTNPEVGAMTDELAAIQNGVLSYLRDNYPIHKPEFSRARFGGLITGAQAYGVHFGTPGSTNPSVIYHDLFKTYAKSAAEAEGLMENRYVEGKIDTRPTTPEYDAQTRRLAFSLWSAQTAGISLHEAAHQLINSEGEQLARFLTFHAADIVSTATRAADALKPISDATLKDVHNTLISFERTLSKYSAKAGQKSTDFIVSQGGYEGYAMADKERGTGDRGGQGGIRPKAAGGPASAPQEGLAAIQPSEYDADRFPDAAAGTQPLAPVTNAVQKQGSDALDVRQPAQNGAGMGIENALPKNPAGQGGSNASNSQTPSDGEAPPATKGVGGGGKPPKPPAKAPASPDEWSDPQNRDEALNKLKKAVSKALASRSVDPVNKRLIAQVVKDTAGSLDKVGQLPSIVLQSILDEVNRLSREGRKLVNDRNAARKQEIADLKTEMQKDAGKSLAVNPRAIKVTPGQDRSAVEELKQQLGNRMRNLADKVERAGMYLNPTDLAANAFDGFQNNQGFLSRYYIGERDRLYNQEYQLVKSLSAPLLETIREHGPYTNAELERISIYANARQGQGLRAMQSGASPDLVHPGKKIGPEKEGEEPLLKLTPKEQAFYDASRTILDKISNMLGEKVMDELNIDWKPVKDYWHMQRDPELYQKEVEPLPFNIKTGDEATDATIGSLNEAFQGFNPKTLSQPNKGIVTERQPGASTPIRLNAADNMTQAIARSARIITHLSFGRKWNAVISSPEFRAQYGLTGQQFWRDQLDTDIRNAMPLGTNHWRMIDRALNNISVATIGLRFIGQFKHATNLFGAMRHATSPQNFIDAFGGVMTGDKAMRTFIRNTAPEIFRRFGGEASIYDTLQRMEGIAPANLWQAIVKGSFALERVVDYGIAAGAYMDRIMGELEAHGMEPTDWNNPKVKIPDEVIRRATIAARAVTTSPLLKDMPQVISRNRGFGNNSTVRKALTQFQSTMLRQSATARQDFWGEGVKKGNYFGAAMAMGLMAAYIIGEANITEANRWSKRHLFSHAGDSATKTDFWRDVVTDALKRSPIPVVGNLLSAPSGESGLPLVDNFMQLLDAAKSLYSGKNRYGNPLTQNEHKRHMIDLTAAVASMNPVLPVPGAQYLADIMKLNLPKSSK